MLRHVFIASVALVLLTASNSFGQIKWLNFSGWDHSQVAGSGQMFANIFEDADVDVEVTANPSFTMNTTSSVAGIFSPRPLAGANTFNFVFSESLPLVVEVQTVDFQEQVRVGASTTKTYSHVFGAQPSVSTSGNNLVIAGVSSRVTATGASRGLIYVNPTNTLSVAHQGSVANKFERFRIGVLTSPIPEPSSIGMALVSAVGLLGLRRRTTLVG